MYIGNSGCQLEQIHLSDCKRSLPRYSARMTDELTTIVLRAIERAPQWIRRDLESKDHVIRIQAEESLAAIIADAIRQADDRNASTPA